MKARVARHLVIDARPRGPDGPLAGERVLGRPVLDHLLQLASQLGSATDAIRVHARIDEHAALRQVVRPEHSPGRVQFVTGPPPEHAAVLRADRLYDASRLRRALKRGQEPESAVIWRLDRPRGLVGADDELTRRQTFQPIGRYWALGPARALARWLAPTWVRPNAVTLLAGGLVLASASAVGWGGGSLASRGFAATGLALALILDTADGHLARLQGTASEFGRWLDSNLDELGDMALHAAIAWATFLQTRNPTWLVLGMVYAMGKYLFMVGSQLGAALESGDSLPVVEIGRTAPSRWRWVRRWTVALGHADVRWHLWIVLAALGRLDAALLLYAAYFPARTCAGLARKVARYG